MKEVLNLTGFLLYLAYRVLVLPLLLLVNCFFGVWVAVRHLPVVLKRAYGFSARLLAPAYRLEEPLNAPVVHH